ncbi:class I SAM-dependent methyltransferase [Patescibacteria group bacterium]|nr:class I SAM-dependent methyltransferase [Patescibacteria group bacterium]
MTKVDEYWNIRPIRNEHTFRALDNIKKGIYTLENSKADSINFSSFPKIKSIFQYDVYKDFDDKVLLDYGCGTGDSMIDALENSKAERVIGIDISTPALELADLKLRLHGIKNKTELIYIDDSTIYIPLPSKSIDYIFSLGTIHHITHPDAIMKEFYRVLKDDGKCMITIYNKDSTTYHYNWVIGALNSNMHVDDFCRNRSDKSAPIGKAYTVKEIENMSNTAGFNSVEFLGGYWSKGRVIRFNGEEKRVFLENDKVDEEHKDFIKAVDTSGRYPMYEGKICGYIAIHILKK